MQLLLECLKREERAEGAIFNAFICKAEKKSASYVKQGGEEPGKQAGRGSGPHSAPQRLPDSGRRVRELRGPQRSSPCRSCWPRGVLGPRSRAALRRRRPTLTPQGGGTTHRSQYGTHVFKPELNRDVHNSVYSGNILAIFSVDSYAYEET